jgi:hypothetical protein
MFWTQMVRPSVLTTVSTFPLHAVETKTKLYQRSFVPRNDFEHDIITTIGNRQRLEKRLKRFLKGRSYQF